MLETHDIIRDPIYGYIKLTKLEFQIIDNKIFQRLRLIKQTPGVSYVYPGGLNSRFLHSIGCCHLSGRICNQIGIDRQKDEQKIRLAALLHDIGHGPFSHVFDDFLDKKNVQTGGKSLTHEKIGKILIEKSEIADILSNSEYGYDPREISEIALGAVDPSNSISPNYALERPIIHGWFDVDRLDYIARDAYFCGIEYGALDVERIINCVKKFGKNLALDIRAIYALEYLYMQRWNMYKAVYFHRTSRAWERQLLNTLSLLDDKMGISSTIKETFLGDSTGELNFVDWVLLTEGSLLSRLTHYLEKSRLDDIYEDPKYLERMLKAVCYRDQNHLLRNIIPFASDLFGRDLSSLPGVVRGVKEEIANEANRILGKKEIDPEKHIFIDTPLLTKKPSEIKPKEEPPLLDGDKPVELRETSPLKRCIPQAIPFSFIFTFPEYRDVVQGAYNEKFGSKAPPTHY